jgi:deazaflavin-dependent oxidoreductase (nitroreductase family)
MNESSPHLQADKPVVPSPGAPPSRGPRLGRRMARFNRAVTNRLTLRFAGHLPGAGIVIHTGRRSGRTYRTPVGLFVSDGSYIIALTYGRESQWVRNVLAAGRCELMTRGRLLELTGPEVFRDERRSAIPFAPRLVLGAVRVDEFLRLSLAEPSASYSSHSS